MAFDKAVGKDGQMAAEAKDHSSKWVGILAFISGAAVMIPSMIALAISLIAVLFLLF